MTFSYLFCLKSPPAKQLRTTCACRHCQSFQLKYFTKLDGNVGKRRHVGCKQRQLAKIQMGQKIKTIFLLAFITTIFYTGYGVLQLGKEGGPCNAGLAIIVLTPFLLICVALLATTFPCWTYSN